MPPDDFVDRFAGLFAIAYRAAFAVLGDRAEAEDCAQDALARALDRWERIDPAAAAPWVARVATNRAIDRWRRRERRVASRAAATAPDLHAAALRADLVRALRALPSRQREAVVLRHLCDLPERDVAVLMGCSTGTVKSTTARGLDRLRVVLGPGFSTVKG